MEGYINENRWIDLSGLPRTNRKNQIDWNKSFGCIMDFMYNSIYGKIKILEKIDQYKYRVEFYVDSDIVEYYFHPSSIKQCNFGMALKKPIAITHPEYIVYFVNIKDAYTYTYQSSKTIRAKCPVCGYERDIAINTLVKQGLACPMCSDGISYPNKFMYNMLSQLHIDFKKEVSKKHRGFEWVNNYKYDFYFENNKIKYFIEMDGGFHYGNGFLSYEQSQTTDKTKDLLAKEHDIEVIRINCNYRGINHRFDFIKNNVITSKLGEIFDLSSICWDDVNLNATESNIKLAADLWNKTEYCTQEIAEYLGLYVNTVRAYLRDASKLNLCDYNTASAQRRTMARNANNVLIRGKNVLTIQN